MSGAAPPTVIVGNPFAPIGRGVTALSFFRAFREAGWPVPIRDVNSWGYQSDDTAEREIGGHLVRRNGTRVTIYHLNVDEVEPALARLGTTLPDGAHNILYPFWELERIPDAWLPVLERFDEIWAPSLFIEQAFREKSGRPVFHMPLPVEVTFPRFLGRPHFGLPEEAFLFLFSFDLRSFIARKNPEGAVRAFELMSERLARSDVQLVVKLHGEETSERSREEFRKFRDRVAASPAADRIRILARMMSDLEVKSLIRCTDSFLSLHRSEGFGLGMAEAMCLGKPVVATRYSGNLDFMTDGISRLVDSSMIPVGAGEYPHSQGQRWAEPDVEQAARSMYDLVADQQAAASLGKRAAARMRVDFNLVRAGLRYIRRIEQITGEQIVP
jgi:glycosyltransferase involved in cell wall biosynthesis